MSDYQNAVKVKTFMDDMDCGEGVVIRTWTGAPNLPLYGNEQVWQGEGEGEVEVVWRGLVFNDLWFGCGGVEGAGGVRALWDGVEDVKGCQRVG